LSAINENKIAGSLFLDFYPGVIQITCH